MYWLVVIVGFLYMGIKERKSSRRPSVAESQSDSSSGDHAVVTKKEAGTAPTVVREVEG